MSPMKSAPYYWLVCDNCGQPADYGDYTAMGDEGYAIDCALDSEWSTDGEKYNCPSCPSIAKCEQCGKPAGENALDRDDHCESCWAELEKS